MEIRDLDEYNKAMASLNRAADVGRYRPKKEHDQAVSALVLVQKAERWAMSMEEQMTSGATVAQVAEATFRKSRLDKSERVAAIAFLTEHWKHGGALDDYNRKHHPKDYRRLPLSLGGVFKGLHHRGP